MYAWFALNLDFKTLIRRDGCTDVGHICISRQFLRHSISSCMQCKRHWSYGSVVEPTCTIQISSFSLTDLERDRNRSNGCLRFSDTLALPSVFFFFSKLLVHTILICHRIFLPIFFYGIPIQNITSLI